jgi:hypothetical protein
MNNVHFNEFHMLAIGFNSHHLYCVVWSGYSYIQELGMNERIGTLIEGEGLMNDGSAIVLFNVFKTAITSRENLTAG